MDIQASLVAIFINIQIMSDGISYEMQDYIKFGEYSQYFMLVSPWSIATELRKFAALNGNHPAEDLANALDDMPCAMWVLDNESVSRETRYPNKTDEVGKLAAIAALILRDFHGLQEHVKDATFAHRITY